MNPWIAFLVVIVMQFFVFLAVALLQKKLHKNLLPILGKAMFLGLVFGIPFDLALGKYLALYTYTLGFTPLFLVVNGIFSFGLWAATVMLLTEKRLVPFCVYVSAICVLYEITNYFFPVWRWQISNIPVLEMGIVLIGYFGLALGGAVVASLLLGMRFKSLEWR